MAMDVERLIECVKNHVFLYDLGHKDYKNTSRKADVWEKIAVQLNENSETVRLKWKTVRDGYIKFKKQLKEGNKKVINYIWSSQLQFLDDYQVSRKKSKIQNVTLASALDLSEEESGTPTQSYSPAPHSILIPSPSDSGPFRNAQTPHRKRKALDQENPGSYLRSKKLKKDLDKYDATDHLFLSYSQTFKTFSPRQQALLKVELAKLFSNAELNALDISKHLQESLVAGSSPGYSAIKHDIDMTDMHTVDVDDDDSDDEEIEFVNPTQTNGRRSRRTRKSSETID